MKKFQAAISSGSSIIIIFFALFGAFFGVFFLPANIIHHLLFDACTIGYGKEPDMKISLFVNVLIIILGLAISWFWATKFENIGTLNGIGTKLVGSEKSLKGYVATKWLVLLFLPIIPIKSYEVFDEQPGISAGLNQRTYYSLHPLPELAKNQIKETYRKSIIWYLLIVLAIISITFIGTQKCF